MKPLLVNAIAAVAAVCSSELVSAFCGSRLPNGNARFGAKLCWGSTSGGGGGGVDDVTPAPSANQEAYAPMSIPIPNDDDLTREALGAILRDIQAHTSSQFEDDKSTGAIEAQADLVDRLRRMRLPGLRLRRCEVRPSTIRGAGRGLFATRPIRRDELITAYPGDALLLWDGRPGPAGCDLRSSFGGHVTPEEKASPDLFLRRADARDYEVQTSAERSVVGDPGRSDDAAYLGHFANDGAALMGGDDALRSSYSLASVGATNAYFVSLEGCHLVTVAMRDIKEDEEVLMSYGEGYWLTRAGPAVTKQAADADAARARARARQEGDGTSPADLLNRTRSSLRITSLKNGASKKSRGFG